MSRFITFEGTALPIFCVTETQFATLALSDAHRNIAKAADFTGKAAQILALYASNGQLEKVYFGTSDEAFIAGKLATTLPVGTYTLHDYTGDMVLAALAFAGRWVVLGIAFR